MPNPPTMALRSRGALVSLETVSLVVSSLAGEEPDPQAETTSAPARSPKRTRDTGRFPKVCFMLIPLSGQMAMTSRLN